MVECRGSDLRLRSRSPGAPLPSPPPLSLLLLMSCARGAPDGCDFVRCCAVTAFSSMGDAAITAHPTPALLMVVLLSGVGLTGRTAGGAERALPRDHRAGPEGQHAVCDGGLHQLALRHRALTCGAPCRRFTLVECECRLSDCMT